MIHKTQEENWRGLLPIQLSLSPSSLSSPSMPPPLFKLVPRHSFLHIALKEEIQRLYAYAPSMMTTTSSEFKTVVEQMDDDEKEEKEKDDSCTTQHCTTAATVTTANNENAVSSSLNAATDAETTTTAQEQDDATTTTTTTLETSLVAATADSDTHTSSTKNTKESSIYKSRGVIPLCWFIDQETNTPLRWHLFIGVLYDRLYNNIHNRTAAGYNSTTLLPWKIYISFTSYPTEILLPLPETPPSSSLSWTSDSNKSQPPTTPVCAITKAVNQIFTNSFKQALFLQYHSNRMALSGMTKQMHQQLWSSVIRNKYELYRPIQEQVMYTQSMTTVESNSTLFRIPVGIFINDHPLKVRPSLPFLPPRSISKNEENDAKNIETQTIVTLGHYLFTNLPSDSFHLLNENEEQVDASKHYIYNPTILETNLIGIPLFTWTIQGIQNIPLTIPLVELWRALCHPDHFLYIIVSLNTT